MAIQIKPEVVDAETYYQLGHSYTGLGKHEDALKAFKQDRSLELIDVSHVEEFGDNRRPPDRATVLFEGDDPRDGPMVRYTIVNRTWFQSG